MNYLESLNSEQKKAALAVEGPVLIVAGAGAGKTKTITHRILHLIETGVAPHNILAITFTNKAAREMRERVIHLMNSSGSKAHFRGGMPFMSTFHSLGVQIIKENAQLLKLPRHFSIYDTADTKKALKDALLSIGIEPKEHLDKVKAIISREKGRGTDFSEFNLRGSYDYTSELTKKVWAKYEETLSREGALDFDDLLLKTLRLLRKYPEVLEKYQNRFQYIHVDEYQDTNKVQNDIVDLLAEKYKNICVVGDTDQNIYSWRGAEIKNMLHFEKTYPDVQTFFLEQNYRSTKNILAVANEIILKNTFRIPKKLFTENLDGEKISIYEGMSEVAEAHFIAWKSKELIRSGVKADNIAVLYRANFQSRVLEDAFLAFGVEYQMLGTKFFERKEVKDVLSFIRAALNPDNLSDFFRVINIPPRGIGKTTVEKIIQGRAEELPEKTKEKINNFRNILLMIKNSLMTDKPSNAVRFVIKKTGMEDLYSTGQEEDTDRLENIMELVSLASIYDEHPPEEGIEKFLTDSALASDQDSLDGEKKGVKLMTVHSSKGLEFDYVFVAGLEADLFPHTKMGNNKKSGEENEEERRLFYVAITRAGKKLFLTWANSRTIFGTREINSPSEFLDDIPAKYTDIANFEEMPMPKSKSPLFSIDF